MKKLLFVHFLFLASFLNLYAQPSDGLVGYWSFDNDNITVFDNSDNNLNGKAVNVSYESGAVNKAAVFDSPADRIFLSDTIKSLPSRIADLDSGTISIWFKYRNVGGQILPLFYYGESSANLKHNSLIIEIGHKENVSDRKLYFTIVDSKFCFDSKINLIEDEWYHFAAVVSSKGNTGYLNGDELTDRNYNLGSNKTYTKFFSSVTSNKLCAIGYGRYGMNSKFFTYKGMIDEVRIYNRPLNAAEIKKLYDEAKRTDAKNPTYENVSYGQFERNVLDFWKAESDKPTPLVVFIHGGGFTSGDKIQARSGENLKYLEKCLANKVSFAAINYRFKESTRLDTIMLDVARAFQFMRYKSNNWNIDKTKIASYGGSAGGGATIWLAFGNDLADPLNADQVLRESTRLVVAGHLNSQATYDFARWPEILELPKTIFDELNITDDIGFYHIPNRLWYDNPEIIELRKKLDMVAMIDKSDPPVYFQNLNPNVVPTLSGTAIHHPKHAIYLKRIYDSLGLDNAIVLTETPIGERVDMLDFFFKYLLKPTGNTTFNSAFKLAISPNPASKYIEIKIPFPDDDGIGSDLKIYNTFGECVFTNTKLQCNAPTRECNIRIDISHLPTGTYLIKIGNYSAKFMVAR